MIDVNYLRVLKELALWRVVPGVKLGDDWRASIENLLQDIPFCLLPNGSLVIGAKSAAALPGSGVCLSAVLAGSGGLLRPSRDDSFFFSELSGFALPEELLGHSFGVYESCSGEKICELEVERVLPRRLAHSVFFLADREKARALRSARRPVVTHPSGVRSAPGLLSAWNLSSLANAALVVHLLKESRGRGNCIGLLRPPGGTSLPGIFPVDFSPLLAPRGQADHGFEFIVPGLPPARVLRSNPGGIVVPSKATGAAVYLKVENPGNVSPGYGFSPESVPEARLCSIIGLSRPFLSALLAKGRRGSSEGDVHHGITIRNEAPSIAGLIRKSKDFSTFLSSGLPKVSAMYREHGLMFTSVRSSVYERTRRGLRAGRFDIDISDATLREWAGECSAFVARLLKAGRERAIEVITGLMMPVTSTSSGGQTIKVFLFPDSVGKDKLKETLFAELSFRLFSEKLSELGVPPRLTRFYAEGARYAVPAALLGGKPAKRLALSASEFRRNKAEASVARAKLDLYISGEMCRLHEGKYHRYFIERDLGDPFSQVSGHGGYGCTLAAVTVSELIESGKFNEKILSH